MPSVRRDLTYEGCLEIVKSTDETGRSNNNEMGGLMILRPEGLLIIRQGGRHVLSRFAREVH